MLKTGLCGFVRFFLSHFIRIYATKCMQPYKQTTRIRRTIKSHLTNISVININICGKSYTTKHVLF